MQLDGYATDIADERMVERAIMANEKRQLLHEIQEVGQKFENCTLKLDTYHGEWHAFSNLYDVFDIYWGRSRSEDYRKAGR